ncbi:Piso0_002757 [Millerozyma farinosa CBS 7064]|uniref:Piso0_002757 protein n=1 Tax=Pichia sorbitophila (strain ATCC MYA-4447 / BCRC 22081 / CBS 7064 / NBRC 10061 / NRRL Y-12695) TaxID=559304 RepID=G8YDF3_PICSO|nr:Piso0_002757 [Millerozyma farinosa CBS 7064]
MAKKKQAESSKKDKDAKKNETSGKKNEVNSWKKTGSNKGDAKSSDNNSDESNGPNRGLAVAGNFGWTGKLPATLVHEHCQKQKWNKPIFDMKRNSKGFIGIAKLSWINPQTKEVIEVQMSPDLDLYSPTETTNEARHFAATYVLHRINYVKNLKMILPTLFRDYYSSLEKKRLEILKSNKELHDSIYNIDPFSVVLAKRAKEEKRKKEQETKARNLTKVPRAAISISSGQTESSQKKNYDLRKKVKSVVTNSTFSKKVWQNAPFIDLPSELRVSIEDTIKHHINSMGWSNKVKQPTKENFELLLELGFRKSHIEESLKYTSTFQDSLEWLLFHIPEDDLPHYFSKTDRDSAVSLKISNNIKFERTFNNIRKLGFDRDDIIKALCETDNDERLTAVKLTNSLIEDFKPVKPDDSHELWLQEIEGMALTGNRKYEFNDSGKLIVTFDISPRKLDKNLLGLKLYYGEFYPNQLPGIQIVVKKEGFKLANYIKLSILKCLVTFLTESYILGECQIFSIIEWMEDNIADIIDNPGPLYTPKVLNKPSQIMDKDSKSRGSQGKNRQELSEVQEKEIQNNYKSRVGSKESESSLESRSKLPAWGKKDSLIDVISSNRVTLITGETGSGKSTQVVQFLLDDMYQKNNFKSTIICTQPRRISTIGLAERVSQERISKVGDETGYIIRGENKTKKTTRLSFVTVGVLLRMLQSFLSSKSDNMSFFDRLEYIIIDEVHERSVDTDFLLIIMKMITSKLPKLKIVLMSATLQIETFKKFFKTDMNHIHIEGRTFPIQDYYLNQILDELDYNITNKDGEQIKPKADSSYFKQGNLNYDLMSLLCLHIDEQLNSNHDNGSVLIFLPGIAEIERCIKQIEAKFAEKDKKTWCLPLHSALSSADQQRVFKSAAPGKRKIVVSTNVAETSITIPDCVVVIDAGKVKTLYYDTQFNSTKLVENWCSKAEVAQRRGRAGRIRSGTCYHVYTKETEMSMINQPVPEIKRVNLENLYLIVKAMGVKNVENFLNSGLDPPEQSTLKQSSKYLDNIGAISDGVLTNLGKYLSLIPTDVHNGKLLIFGCIFGCLDFALTMASISAGGNLFVNSFQKRDEIKQILKKFSKQSGDSIALYNLISEYERLRTEGKSTREFMSNNYLSYTSIRDILSSKAQFLALLKEIGFAPLDYNSSNKASKSFINLNRNRSDVSVQRALLTGAYYPQIARVQFPDPKYVQSIAGSVEVDPDERKTKIWIRKSTLDVTSDSSPSTDTAVARAFLHPSSVLFNTSKNDDADGIDLGEFLNDDESLDVDKWKKMTENLQPKVSNNPAALKHPFIVYMSSHQSTKLYLREVTPTSVMVTLLFGGEISYDILSYVSAENAPTGIILDDWIPVRTWCKNGVLIKKLRGLLDMVIQNKLSHPTNATNLSSNDPDNEVLTVIEDLLRN